MRSQSPTAGAPDHSSPRTPHVLDPAALPEHLDALYRAAWALCGSQHDAEDLVQTTFAYVLKRPRVIRHGNERGYLLRALRNTYSSHYRMLKRRPLTLPLLEDDRLPASDPRVLSPREIMAAVATAPPLYRDAVIAVDVIGLSYREAARSLRTREQTITSRLHRGRQHIAHELIQQGA